MNKNYYFMSGLYRSGNTLLSAILNQNPEIYVSPLSPLVEFMWQCHSSMDEAYIINPNKKNADHMISKMIENYYQEIEKPFVFDRSKAWLNPDNLFMIKKYIDPNPKIIFTIRPLRECIASILKIEQNKKFTNMQYNNSKKYNFISENDNIVETILNGNITGQWTGINPYRILRYAHISYSNKENLNNIHLVKYEDLVNTPENTMNNLYEFLGFNKFSHDFNNIERKEKELDNLIGRPGLHEIAKQIKPSTINPLDYMSQKMIDKCDEMDLFYK
jgi:sulfotransferase